LYHTPEWLNRIATLPELDINIKFFGGHKQWVPFNWIAENESHFAFEMMLILEGIQRTRYDGRVNEYKTGDIILIPPGTNHENQSVSPDGLEYFSIHFDIDEPNIQHHLLMYCPLLLNKETHYFFEINKTLHILISLLKEEYTIKEKLHVEQLIIELTLNLLDYSKEERIKIDESDNTSLILAKDIAETIRENFNKFTKEPTVENRKLISIETVADSLNISNSSMLKAFKKVYSLSPKEYLDQLRYNKTKSLLNQPKLSIGKISEMIGYQNTSHFSRQFKKWSGYSPKDYKLKQISS
jgi:AraC-like DNA-binding protein